MKIKSYETALKLSQITGRPLEDFYEAPVEDDNKEEIEDHGVDEEVKAAPILVQNEPRTPFKKHGETTLHHVKYGGQLTANGVVICHTKNMTHTEYKTITKNMTQDEIIKSPLFHVLFRAEGQVEGHLWHWLEKFPKERV